MSQKLKNTWHKIEEFLAPSDWGGQRWNEFLSRNDNPYEAHTISFKEISKELRLIYHMMGGVQTKTLYATDKTSRLSLRSFMQKATGDKAKFYICWQDKKALYLPIEIALFSTKELNKMYYVWMVALMANAKVRVENWAEENVRVQRYLLEHYVGFRKAHKAMIDELFKEREAMVKRFKLSSKSEEIFNSLLYGNGEFTPEQLPTSQELYPFALWLYPAPKQDKYVEGFEEYEEEGNEGEKSKDSESLDVRKKASRTNDESETDGFMAFLPEGLMTISERINVDRSEDDSEDEDAAFNAQDLDELSLGKKKKGLASKLKIDLELPTEEIDTYAVGEGIKLDEWDYTKESYLKDYCLLTPIYIKSEQEKELDHQTQRLANKVKEEFATYAFNRVKEKNLPFGEELNLDAWIAYATSSTKSQEKQNFFENVVRKQRDLSTLILADISLSTEAMVTNELNILDIIKQSLFVFADALDTLDDPLAIYAFSSVKNSKVRYHVLKNFNEAYSAQIRGRIDDLRAGYYTRLGAAIRQSTRILEKQGSQNKLMLIISDGKPNDVDKYEGRYGVEDTKKAILEARKFGIIPFCITVDSESYEYLPQIFGKDGYTYIRDIKKLPEALPEIYLGLTET